MNSSTWLILGSGPGASDTYERVKTTMPEDTIIATCNAGLRIEPFPDIYWLTDSEAVQLYIAEACDAKECGAIILTHKSTVRKRNQMRALASIVLDYRLDKATAWTPGELCNCRTSGGMLAQLAVNNGARFVHMIGMAGYASRPGKPADDYFDGRKGKNSHESVMRSYGPVMQSLFDQSPDVRFTFYGTVNWPWGGDNVAILTQHAEECSA